YGHDDPLISRNDRYLSYLDNRESAECADATERLRQDLGARAVVDADVPVAGVAERRTGIHRDAGVFEQKGCGVLAPVERRDVDPREEARVARLVPRARRVLGEEIDEERLVGVEAGDERVEPRLPLLVGRDPRDDAEQARAPFDLHRDPLHDLAHAV